MNNTSTQQLENLVQLQDKLIKEQISIRNSCIKWFFCKRKLNEIDKKLDLIANKIYYIKMMEIK